jgi:hypothetical protein
MGALVNVNALVPLERSSSVTREMLDPNLPDRKQIPGTSFLSSE